MSTDKNNVQSKRRFRNALCWTVSEYRRHDVLDKLVVVTGKPTRQWLRELDVLDRRALLEEARRISRTQSLEELQNFVPATSSWVAFALAISVITKLDAEMRLAPAGTMIVSSRLINRFNLEFLLLLNSLLLNSLPSVAKGSGKSKERR